MSSLIQAVVALLAIANPIGAAPIFLGLTEGLDQGQRRRQAVRASAAVFVILTISVFLGNRVLGAFGISFAAFQAAGGLVIVLMGLEMLAGSPTRVQHHPGGGKDKDDPILVPFAMPMIAGPGAITTVITLTAGGSTVQDQATVLIAVIILTVMLLLTLWVSVWLGERVGMHGHGILLRFMGLILVAMGAQFLLSGIQSFGV